MATPVNGRNGRQQINALRPGGGDYLELQTPQGNLYFNKDRAGHTHLDYQDGDKWYDIDLTAEGGLNNVLALLDNNSPFSQNQIHQYTRTPGLHRTETRAPVTQQPATHTGQPATHTGQPTTHSGQPTTPRAPAGRSAGDVIAGAGGGALTGAVAGAAIGSVVPVVGTFFGGVIGAVVGGVVGTVGGDRAAAFGRGVLNTVTLGHGDQVVAWAANTYHHPSQIFRAPPQAEVQAQHRRNAELRREHPGWAAAGEIAGVPVAIATAVALPGPTLLWLAGGVFLTGGMDWYSKGRPGGLMGLLGSIWDDGWGTISGIWSDASNWANKRPLGAAYSSNASADAPAPVSPSDDHGHRNRHRDHRTGPDSGPTADPNTVTLPANANERQIRQMAGSIQTRLRDMQAGSHLTLQIEGTNKRFVFTKTNANGMYQIECFEGDTKVDGRYSWNVNTDGNTGMPNTDQRTDLGNLLVSKLTGQSSAAPVSAPTTGTTPVSLGTGVHFDLSKSTIDAAMQALPGNQAALDAMVANAQAALARDPHARFNITGHADQVPYHDSRTGADHHVDGSKNTQEQNALSTRRAQALKDYLVAHGIPADQIDVQGVGTTGDPDPLGTNNSQYRSADGTYTIQPPPVATAPPPQQPPPQADQGTQVTTIDRGAYPDRRPQWVLHHYPSTLGLGGDLPAYRERTGDYNMPYGRGGHRGYRSVLSAGVNVEHWNSRRFEGRYVRYDAGF